jgi:SAM-dependent MidA family methyltransferase
LDYFRTEDVFNTHVAPSRNVVRVPNGKLDYLHKENIGKGNITSAVDFTALERIGRDCGLVTSESLILTDAISRFRPGTFVGEMACLPEEEKRRVLGDRKLMERYLGHLGFTESFTV